MKDFRTYIIDRGVITAERLEAISVENRSNEPIYYQLLRKFPELEEPIWRALADFLQITLVNPQEIDLNPQLTHLLPAQMAHEFSIVPLSRHGQKVEVGMADPQQFEKCEEFSMLLMREGLGKDRFQDPLVVEGRLALPSDVAKMIRELYGIGAETVQEIIDEQITPEIMILGPEVVDLTKQEEEGEITVMLSCGLKVKLRENVNGHAMSPRAFVLDWWSEENEKA